MNYEVFEFEPISHEIERARLAKQSPKQLLRGGKKQLAIAERRYIMAWRNSTSGQQFLALKHMVNIAAEYGIEVDVYYRWMLALHEKREEA